MKRKIIYIMALCCLVGGGPTWSRDNTYTQQQVSAIREAARAGDSDAQFELASLYQQGDSVQQDDHEAVKWYRLAANQNNPDAQFALGFCYRGGFGVDKDLVLSYMWFDIAINRGNEEAGDLRSTVAELMTYDQISEARAASRKWRTEHPVRY